MSDTPRTDAAEVDLSEVTCTAFAEGKQVVVTKYVPSYKMREMERELAAERAAREQAERETIQWWGGIPTNLSVLIDAARGKI